jgi:cytochrome P460
MKKAIVALGVAYGIAFSLAVGAQQVRDDGPRYTNGTNLVRPTDYRAWPFLGSGLGMTYDEPAAGAQSSAPQMFSNVFVNPSSYRSFMETGKWPDKTVFVLEFRNSGSEASINKAGRFQTNLAFLEAEVKDSRFPDGWAFFGFGSAGSMKDAAEPLAGKAVAGCIECHTKHTAVERTFVQFYPTLMEVARRMGTVKPGF